MSLTTPTAPCGVSINDRSSEEDLALPDDQRDVSRREIVHQVGDTVKFMVPRLHLAGSVHQQEMLSAALSYARENKLSLYLGALSHQKLSLCLQKSLRLHTTYPSVVIVLSRQWGQRVWLRVL
jgi:hypothetical protein